MLGLKLIHVSKRGHWELWLFKSVIVKPIIQMIAWALDMKMFSCEWHMVSGGRLNKKDGLTRYGNSHVKDKTS